MLGFLYVSLYDLVSNLCAKHKLACFVVVTWLHTLPGFGEGFDTLLEAQILEFENDPTLMLL